MNASAGEEDEHDIFTDKQRRVLDLLIEHKTSKEIARALGISPYTVDQRISLARAKLGVSSRSELAARYQAMRKTPAPPLEDFPASSAVGQARVPSAGESDSDGPSSLERNSDPIRHQAGQDDHLTTQAPPDPERISCPTDPDPDYRVGPEVFEGSSGGLWRIGAVVATALVLVVTVLGLFAIFNQLNEMLS